MTCSTSSAESRAATSRSWTRARCGTASRDAVVRHAPRNGAHPNRAGGGHMTGPRDWDAATYDRIADPMTRWGAAVLDRLPLEGDETVLDAGCGSGRVTEQLVARLPRGRVVALDASPRML